MSRRLTWTSVEVTGGTHSAAHGGIASQMLVEWLEGNTRRLTLTFDDGQRASLTPQREFTGRSRSLTLRVGFDPPRHTARRAPARRAA